MLFEKELTFFRQNQDDLVARYPQRVLLIRGEKVEGDFASVLEAYLEGRKRFEPGTFMVQPCLAGRDAYTITLSPQVPEASL